MNGPTNLLLAIIGLLFLIPVLYVALILGGFTLLVFLVRASPWLAVVGVLLTLAGSYWGVPLAVGFGVLMVINWDGIKCGHKQLFERLFPKK